MQTLFVHGSILKTKVSLFFPFRTKFKQKLTKIKDHEDEAEEKKEVGGEAESDEDVAGDSWMKNTLRFESNDPVLAKDASTKVSFDVMVACLLVNYFFSLG